MFYYLRREAGFYRRLVRLALPLVLQNLITTSLGFVDTFMVGLLGQDELSAVTAANTPVFLVQIIILGLISGLTVLVSQYWGKGDVEAINRCMGAALYAGLSISGAVALALLLFPNGVMALVTDNVRLVELGAPALGITGAAVATLASRIVEFLITLVCALCSRHVPLLPAAILRPGGVIWRDFAKYSAPVLVNETLWGLGVSVMTAIMGHMAISAEMLAAYAVMGNIEKFATVACFGVAGAASVMVGKRIGEGAEREEVYSLVCCLLLVSVLVGVAVSLVLAALLPTVFIPVVFPLFHLEGLSLRVASIMGVVLICMMPTKAMDITNITGLLRAGGDARMASVIDLSCQWIIAVPLAFVTALVLDAPAAVVCFAIQSENFCKAPWCVLRLRSRKWINDVTRGFV